MQRTTQYRDEGVHRSGGMASDIETWLGNSLATILAGVGIAGGVIGWFVAMGYITHAASLSDFEGGMVWMVGGIILTVAANVFRREHHIVEPRDAMRDTRVMRD
jgi:hypothetical protein